MNKYFYAGKFSYVCCALSVGKEQKVAVVPASAVIELHSFFVTLDITYFVHRIVTMLQCGRLGLKTFD